MKNFSINPFARLLFFISFLVAPLAFAQEGEDVIVAVPDADQSVDLPNSDPQVVQPQQAPAEELPQLEEPAPKPVPVAKKPKPAPAPRQATPVPAPQYQQPAQQPYVVKKKKSWEPPPNPNDWSTFLTLGLTFGNGTSTSINGGTATDDTGSTKFIIGGEINYRLYKIWKLLMVGFAMEYNTYSTSTESTTNADSDKHLGFYLLPRLYKEFGDTWIFTPFFALGLGLNHTSVGSSTAAVASSVGIDTSATGFAFSPRIGCDLEINENLLVGLQLAYTRFSSTLSSASGSAAASVTSGIDFTRHWFAISARVGTQF